MQKHKKGDIRIGIAAILVFLLLLSSLSFARSVTMNLAFNIGNTKDNIIRVNGTSTNATVSSTVDKITKGPNSGLAFASTGSGTAWSNPSYAQALDSSRAIAELSATGASKHLHATNFNFSIPSTATINGILVEITENYKHHSGSEVAFPGICDTGVYIIKNGADTGTNHSIPYDAVDQVCSWNYNQDTYVSYGNSSDTWGTTWTPEDINSINFGVSIAAINLANAAQDAKIDHIRITVYYTPEVVYADLDKKFISSERNSKIMALVFTGSEFLSAGFKTTHSASDYLLYMKQDDDNNRFLLAFTNGTFVDIENKAKNAEDFHIISKLLGNMLFSTPGRFSYFLRLEYRGIDLINRTRFEGPTKLLIKNVNRAGNINNVTTSVI